MDISATSTSGSFGSTVELDPQVSRSRMRVVATILDSSTDDKQFRNQSIGILAVGKLSGLHGSTVPKDCFVHSGSFP